MALAQFTAHYDNGNAQFNAAFGDGFGYIILNGQPAALLLVALLGTVAINDGAETMRYLSCRPFKSAGSDTQASTVYRPLVIGSSMRTVERMSLSAETALLPFGDIELTNVDGALAVCGLPGGVRWYRRGHWQPLARYAQSQAARQTAAAQLKTKTS